MRNADKSSDRFSDDREALDFIASRIALEAQREGIPFSEVERKMLYFSETAWTLPDIWEVNDKFDSEYNQVEYEKKVSNLVKRAVTRARKQQPEELNAWNEAIRRLSKDDRYLLVMTGQAGLARTLRSDRPPGDVWKLLGTAISIVGLLLGFGWISGKYGLGSGRGLAYSRGFVQVAFWIVFASAAGIYGLLWLLLGGQRVNRATDRVIQWFFGPHSRDR
jgi:hypothetical protein